MAQQTGEVAQHARRAGRIGIAVEVALRQREPGQGEHQRTEHRQRDEVRAPAEGDLEHAAQ